MRLAMLKRQYNLAGLWVSPPSSGLSMTYFALQDACRQFASETSGKKKYELYMQASRLSKSPLSVGCNNCEGLH